MFRNRGLDSIKTCAFVWLLTALFSPGAVNGSISRELVIRPSGPVPEIVVASAAGTWERPRAPICAATTLGALSA
jgi:hypothetical protein